MAIKKILKIVLFLAGLVGIFIIWWGLMGVLGFLELIIRALAGGRIVPWSDPMKDLVERPQLFVWGFLLTLLLIPPIIKNSSKKG